jgi:hypothetical protein
VNTHAEYRRHLGERTATAGPEAPAPEQLSHLSRHGDPSLTRPTLRTPTGRHIAWVRPTELHSYAGGAIGRGIDLQAELARRASRAPHTVARSVRSAAPGLRSRPAPTASQEGLQR